MSDEEKKFQQYVDSLRFDDAPSKEHQDKLEKRLLEAYDYQQKYGNHVEPVAVYLRKLAIAAGFLIVCGVLFWGIDKAFITKETDFIAQHPDKEILEEIIVEEQATGDEKSHLIAKMSDIWDMIRDQDADALVSVLQSDNVARKVRTWAASYLGQFGTERTLAMLEDAIGRLEIADPNDPIRIAASKIRARLHLGPVEEDATETDTEESESPSMRSADNS